MIKVLQLEVELQTIERVVRRIEQANSGSTQQTTTGGINGIFASNCCVSFVLNCASFGIRIVLEIVGLSAVDINLNPHIIRSASDIGSTRPYSCRRYQLSYGLADDRTDSTIW